MRINGWFSFPGGLPILKNKDFLVEVQDLFLSDLGEQMGRGEFEEDEKEAFPTHRWLQKIIDKAYTPPGTTAAPFPCF